MQRITGFEIFNIADSRTATLNQLITTVSKAYNLPDKTWHVNKRLAAWAGSSLQAAYHRLGITTPPAVTPYIVAQMASHYTLDLTKAREKLGYTSPYDYTQAAFFYRVLNYECAIISQCLHQFLATKLYIPPLRPKAARRGHLMARLNEGLHRKLTISSAPAGSGKKRCHER